MPSASAPTAASTRATPAWPTPARKAGAELLARLIREGLMPVGSGYPEMEAAVAQGRVAMMINGPWAWVNLQAHGHGLRRRAHPVGGRQAGGHPSSASRAC
jgi:ABC-type glycerol-3-phosphate transport system substrate-binding protein